MSITLNGLATIRAFRAQKLFKDQYYRYQDDHSSTHFMCISASRCLGITMDWVCWGFVFFVALFIMVFNESIASNIFKMFEH